ncbi:MAG: GAF domain-containing protein [Leptolyngbyaceae bacterium]|nr:GAF domain-containing protein [Leptolyngbyaceae bacterium]
MAEPFNLNRLQQSSSTDADGLSLVLKRLNQNMQRDQLVQQTTDHVRQSLQVDRVILYYFYSQWQGQVTFESLSSPALSILGSTGPEDCFNEEYASLYLAGRVKAIANIEVSDITPCHRDFLRNLYVRANLVVPILIPTGLWGLLIAHHCQGDRPWSQPDINIMQQAASTLATAPSILRQE